MGLKVKFKFDFLEDSLKKNVHNSIERDLSKWVYYGECPSSYITSKESIFYKESQDIVQKELDYLIETKPKDDVWGITWTWFENNEKYAREFAVSKNWWKAYKAIEKMKF